jgi:hypothetical protein
MEEPKGTELAKLAKKATSKGLWFYYHYTNRWFSPEELQEKQKNRKGRSQWLTPDCLLRDPTERLEELDDTILALTEERSRFERRVNTWREKCRAHITRARPAKVDKD